MHVSLYSEVLLTQPSSTLTKQ